MSQDVYLVEAVAYTGAGTATLRYATQGFVTGPAETPANTYYDGRVIQPLQLQRWFFASNSTHGRSTLGFGDIVLDNSDGELDNLIKYGFDGRTVTVRRGAVGAAYPGGFTTLFVGTMGPPESEKTTFTLKLRDKQLEANVPLQATKYTGAGLGTLEGVADDLKGKPKPVCYGKVLNIQPPAVETAKLIYQVNDGAVASIVAVYDRGVALKSSYPLLALVGGSASPMSQSTNGTTWATAPASPTMVTAIAYADNLWMLGTDGGALRTSVDGVTFANRDSALGFSSTDVRCISYGGGKWIVGGGSGKLAYSTDDGVTWTRIFGYPWTTNTLRGIAFTGNLWVVSYAGAIAYSADGLTWTQVTIGSATLRSIVYGAGLFVVVGGDSSGVIYTSPDGVVWTSRTAPTSAVLSAVTWNGTVFCVVGETGASGPVVATSTDGITWTTRTSAVTTQRYAVAWSSALSLFVSVGQGVSSPFAGIESSPDGTTWTARNDTANKINRAIAFGEGGTADVYATSTDLLDNTKAPAAGKFKAFLNASGSYFRLGATPDGLVTADVTEGAAASNRTAAQVYKRLLDDRLGKTTGDWNATDITTLDTANDDVIGYWTDQETTYGAVFDKAANSVGASWYIDVAGVFCIKQLLAPSGSPVLVITANALLKPLRRKLASDLGQGLPSYQTIVRYAKNHTVQVSDVAPSVTDARRAFLAAEWRDAKDTDATVQTKHLLAVQNAEESLLTVEADAVAEAVRRQALRGVQRHLYEAVIPLDDDSDALDLTDVVEINHDRYLLDANSLFRVLGIDLNAKDRTLTLTCWGRGAGE